MMTAPAVIEVSIARSELLLRIDGEETAYPASTSLSEPSQVLDSGGTPRGLHVVIERIGDREPIGTVFKGRVSIGRTYEELEPQEQEGNLITTRILRLLGMEPGFNVGEGPDGSNVDSYARFIYIHGTNHEDRVGQPASGGCVQLRNEDMLALFDKAPVGTYVYIH